MEFTTELTEVISRTRSVKSFRFRRPPEAGFKPGQYFFLTIDAGGKDAVKPFSFSSSPLEKKYIEFTKRITDSPFSKRLDTLEAGYKAKIKMPFGQFTYEGEYEKAAFLAGGIGITPLRSICGYVMDMKIPADIILFYGNRDMKEIIFKDDFDKMTEVNPLLKVVYTLTGQQAENGGGSCRTGRIDKGSIKREIPDYAERVFYVCGPPEMVKCLICVLKDELSLPENNIKQEFFAGY
ncbi:MAG: FAD-dependent oxidoreductase [Candidatus Omnitrophota bacterium]